MPKRSINRSHKHCKDSSSFAAMTETNNKKRSHRNKKQAQDNEEAKEEVPQWRSIRSLFSCKFHKKCRENKKTSKRVRCITRSLCHNIKDSNFTAHEAEKKLAANTLSSCNTSSRSLKPPSSDMNAAAISASISSTSSAAITASSLSSSFSSLGGSFRSVHLRRFSGCYECQIMADSINGHCTDSSASMRASISPCSDCGEIFTKPEGLELHQAINHAVSELDSEDSSRNIIGIIFQSSWLKKQAPHCKIDRILKVHNTQKTITRFENYRDFIKNTDSKLSKKHPRCVADGNELLRFYSTTFSCTLGLNGSTNLCQMIPHCNACSIIRDGFKVDEHGRIQTMSTSGRAHDVAQISTDEKRAMLVCRVIAGRVKRSQDATEEHDSVSISAGTTYTNMDELFVFSPKAILACFVVIYRCL